MTTSATLTHRGACTGPRCLDHTTHDGGVTSLHCVDCGAHQAFDNAGQALADPVNPGPWHGVEAPHDGGITLEPMTKHDARKAALR